MIPIVFDPKFARIVTNGISEIDTGYVVTRKGFKKRVDKLDLSFMNYQDAFKSKSTMEVSIRQTIYYGQLEHFLNALLLDTANKMDSSRFSKVPMIEM